MPSRRRHLMTLAPTGLLSDVVPTLLDVLAREPKARYDLVDGEIVVSAPPAQRARPTQGDPRFGNNAGVPLVHVDHPTTENP